MNKQIPKAKVFRIQKDISNKLIHNVILRRKFIQIKNSLKKTSELDKDFICMFEECNKSFPKFNRWMMHYKMHVIN